MCAAENDYREVSKGSAVPETVPTNGRVQDHSSQSAVRHWSYMHTAQNYWDVSKGTEV